MNQGPRSGLKFAKPEPCVLLKKRRAKTLAKQERACREIVRKRDHGKCRITGCKERADHLHHIVFRSQSKAQRWDPSNLASLCAEHHRLLHCGDIRIAGNADRELVITGNIDLLRFRL